MRSGVGRGAFGRRGISAGVAVATIAALVLHGSMAIATPSTVAPPFNQSATSTNCVPSGPALAAATGTCSTTTTVDPRTGAFDVASAVTSAGNGGLPLTAYNGVFAQVDLGVSQAITTAPTSITYTISYHVDKATTSPGSSTSPVSAQGSGSRAWLSASASMSSCACGYTQVVNLVDSGGSAAPTQLSDVNGTITLTVTNSNGGPVTPGTMSISLGANSGVIADPLTAGSVGSSAAGAITSIIMTSA